MENDRYIAEDGALATCGSNSNSTERSRSLWRRTRQRHSDPIASQPESELEGRASEGMALGNRLSRISCSAKYALPINQIERIEISKTFERPEDGVTMYVVDVYLQYVQTGIPLRKNADGSVVDEQTAHKKEKPDYQMEYRYSDFRVLRERLREAVENPEDPMHLKWCRYCGRVQWMVYYASFPSRTIMNCLGKTRCYKTYLVRRRQQKLAFYLQRLLRAAKDNSYRFGGDQCEGFVNVSYILKDFLVEPHQRTSCTGW